MKTPKEIKQLAYARLEEAEILCAAGKYEGAFYLAGYSVELMLKAKICENFGIDNLFDEKPEAVIYGVSEARKAVKTHDIRLLLIYSGLTKKFKQEPAPRKLILMETYTYLISGTGGNDVIPWSEKIRYLPIGSKEPQEVKELIRLLKDAQGLLEWIKEN